jgi:cell division septation protein DedD
MIKVNKLVSALVISSLATTLYAIKIEVMPTVGKAFKASDDSLQDDEILYGVRGTVFLNNEVGVQAAYEASTSNVLRNSGGAETDIERVSVNAIYQKDTGKRVRPYILVGMGNESTHGSVAPKQNDGSQGFINAGAGLKFGLTKRVDVVTEAKWIRKLSNNDNDIIATVGLGVNTGVNKPKAPSIPSVNATSEVQNALNLAEFRKISEEKAAAASAVAAAAPAVAVAAPLEVVDEGIPADAIILDESAIVDQPATFVEDEVIQPAASDSGYYVQMAALFQGDGSALTSRLEQKDYPYVLHNVTKGSREATLVLVGPYESRTEASVALGHLKRLKSDAFVYFMN